MKDVTGSYTGTLVPVAAMLLVATVLPAIARPPGAPARAMRAPSALLYDRPLAVPD